MANQTPSMRITLVWQAQFLAYSIFLFRTLIPSQLSPWDQSSRMNNGRSHRSPSCLDWLTQRRSGHGSPRSHLTGCVPSAPHWPRGQNRVKDKPTQPFLALTQGLAPTPGLCLPECLGSSEQHKKLVLSPRHHNIVEGSHEEVSWGFSKGPVGITQQKGSSARQSPWMSWKNTYFEERRRR